MSLNVGLLVAAVTVVVAAIVCVAIAIRARNTVPASSRVARWIMVVGSAVAIEWIVAASITAAIGPQGASHRHQWALAGAIGLPLAVVLMLAGVERLPGVIDSAATRLRRRLDVLLMAPAIFLTGWIFAVIFGNNSQQIHPHPNWNYLAGGPPVLAATLALAFGIAIVMRSGQTRRVVALLMAGVVAVALGGAAIVVGLLADRAWGIVVGGAVVGIGLIVLAWCATPHNQLLELPSGSGSPSWSMSVVTISVALVMIVCEVLKTGSLDSAGAGAGVLCGFALVARQGLALVDARHMSERLREDEVHLRQMAFTDALTGVGNRRELLRVLQAEAVGGPDCVLLSIDLDGFKNVNDLRGHDVGDTVLVEVAQRLRANLRPGDVAARMGGDEFAVLMWAKVDDASIAAHRLLATLALPYQSDVGSIFISASIGLAGCGSATDIAGLLRNADLALRFAKMKGKARCERYDKKYEEWLRRRTTVEHELREVVKRGELSLAFQPVVALPSGVPVGVEALVRWSHPSLGMVPPDEFIPIAEESGLISQVDKWVMGEACRQLARWLEAGHDLWLAVNISAREMHLVDYVAQVLDTLRMHHVPADRLVLEITERTVAEDIDEMVEQLTALRAAGVRIALDDFGAGYSSLGQLRTLPVDILKIDRSLVGDEQSVDSREAAPLVDVVVRLGRRLGLQVIAEGVAVQAEREIVQGAGCKLGQGDLFARPMPAEHIEAMLANAPTKVPRPRRPKAVPISVERRDHSIE